jgi:phosphoglycerate kinase
VTAPELTAGAVTRVVPRTDVGPADRIGDIGPASTRLFSDQVAGAGTVVWNGPMGMFEVAQFSAGTVELAHVAARAADEGTTVVLGGGDSAAAAEAAGVASRMTHVSTGGGAALEFLSGAELPGVEALSDRT